MALLLESGARQKAWVKVDVTICTSAVALLPFIFLEPQCMRRMYAAGLSPAWFLSAEHNRPSVLDLGCTRHQARLDGADPI